MPGLKISSTTSFLRNLHGVRKTIECITSLHSKPATGLFLFIYLSLLPSATCQFFIVAFSYQALVTSGFEKSSSTFTHQHIAKLRACSLWSRTVTVSVLRIVTVYLGKTVCLALAIYLFIFLHGCIHFQSLLATLELF